ncbi:MAG: hypothetical protein FWF09_04400, partial [Bacteroidales bacterium]|nr:hypothetical protein [Bacteroidales bacterium]
MKTQFYFSPMATPWERRHVAGQARNDVREGTKARKTQPPARADLQSACPVRGWDAPIANRRKRVGLRRGEPACSPNGGMHRLQIGASGWDCV